MKIRYVVIDDAAFLRELIKNIMSSRDAICVGEADDGVAGVELVQDTLPDLAFVDMVMPRMNGIETARSLKEIHPEIKIIGCSTMDSEKLIEDAMNAGFDKYLMKPFSKEELIQTVMSVLPKNQGR